MPGVASDLKIVKLRPSRSWLIVVLFLLFCVTPLAFVGTPLLVLYVIPLGVLLWIFRSGTDIDADGLTVRAIAGRRRISWDEVQALSPAPRGELRAVLKDGRLLPLPQVRLRHLDLIAAVSGGRVPTVNDAAAGEPAPPSDDRPADQSGDQQGEARE